MFVCKMIANIVLTIGMPMLLIWVTYLINNSKNVSKSAVGLLFSLGACSIYCILLPIAIMLQSNPFLAQSLSGLAYRNYVSVGLSEELYKFIILIFILKLGRPTNLENTSIVYAVTVSLGFAFVENIHYIVYDMTWVTLLGRTFICMPMHWTYGVCMGYMFEQVILIKQKYHCNCLKILHVFAILLPTLLHGTHDFLIEADIDALHALLYDLAAVVTGVVMLIKQGADNSQTDKNRLGYIQSSLN